MEAFTKRVPLEQYDGSVPSIWCFEQQSVLVVCGTCHRILPAKQCARCKVQTISTHLCDAQEKTGGFASILRLVSRKKRAHKATF